MVSEAPITGGKDGNGTLGSKLVSGQHAEQGWYIAQEFQSQAGGPGQHKSSRVTPEDSDAHVHSSARTAQKPANWCGLPLGTQCATQSWPWIGDAEAARTEGLAS